MKITLDVIHDDDNSNPSVKLCLWETEGTEELIRIKLSDEERSVAVRRSDFLRAALAIRAALLEE